MTENERQWKETFEARVRLMLSKYKDQQITPALIEAITDEARSEFIDMEIDWALQGRE